MLRLSALLFLLTWAGAAQPVPGLFPWWDSPVVRDLHLSDDQTAQIRNVTREYRGRLIDQRAAVEKAEGDVQDVFNDDPLDSRRGTEAIDRLVAARSELTRTFSQLSLRLRGVLTAGQWRELQRRRPPGPQPPGPPPQGPPPPGGRRPEPPAGQPRY